MKMCDAFVTLCIYEHGCKSSPFHPFRGRGWRRSQNGVGHKMRREEKKGERRKKGEKGKREKKGKTEEKERERTRKKERIHFFFFIRT